MSGTPERTRYCSRCLTTFPSDVARCPNLGCRATRPAAGWGELLEPGEVLDRTYKLHARLAIGGAGVTYLGGELGTDGVSEVGPRVAIKVLYQQRDQGPYLRRLSTEAQILQGLNHPQIVECRGFVHRAGHSPYLVTRYEEGGSLLDHLRRVGTLSIPVAAGVGRQICWALEVAHRQGVVHRDLKPENVLLEREVPGDTIPPVRVADFGIAKVYGGVGDRLTRVGAFVGTPQYAAPEQFDGLAPEPATDVYAVGALLYFCMTARPVADFMAELDPDSQRDHLVRHLPPRLPHEIGPPDARRWMDETLAAAMAVDPGDRCDISQLEARLAALQELRDPGFLRPPPPVFVSPSTVDASVMTADTLDTSHVRPLGTDDALSTGGFRGTAALGGAAGGAAAAGGGAAAGAAAGGGTARGGAPAVPGPPPLPPEVRGAGESGAWRSPDVQSPGAATGGGATGGGATGTGVGANGPGGGATGAGAGPAGGASAGPPRTSGGASGSTGSGRVPIAGPTRTATGEARGEGSSVGKLGCGVLVAGGGAAALVGAALLAWWLMPAEPAVLTGTETDAAALAEWRLVAGTLGERGLAAEKACEAPPYLAIEVVIEGTGQLRAAKLLNYPHEPTRACIEQELRKEVFPRKGTEPVQVAVTLTK